LIYIRQRLGIPVGTAAICLAAVAAFAGQTQRERQAPDTDRSENVARGARLSIDNFAGEVIVRSWDKDVLKVTARHSSRTKISIRNTPTAVAVSSSSNTGVASVDYEITVPAWMPVKIDGTYNFVSIEGVQSEVSASTTRGDITIKGGSGFVTARSIEGVISVDGAKGRISAESVNEGIKIANSSGDIVAETTNGDISLIGVDARSVDVGTINGDVAVETNLAGGGRYRITTHNGDIVLATPETASATISVRTYNGDFRSYLPLKGASPSDARRGKRVTFTLGAGSAEVELESFGGTIRIERPGTVRGRDKEKKEDVMHDGFGTVLFESEQLRTTRYARTEPQCCEIARKWPVCSLVGRHGAGHNLWRQPTWHDR
jgi:DUF4097 and DUF4098 domain-containing protein YvlB